MQFLNTHKSKIFSFHQNDNIQFSSNDNIQLSPNNNIQFSKIDFNVLVVLLLLSVQNCQFKTNICLWLEGFYNFNFMINFFSSFSNLFPSLTCYDSLDMILYLSVLVCQINLCLFLLSSKDFSFSFYSLFCTFVNFQVTIYDLLMNNYKRQVCFAVFFSLSFAVFKLFFVNDLFV